MLRAVKKREEGGGEDERRRGRGEDERGRGERARVSLRRSKCEARGGGDEGRATGRGADNVEGCTRWKRWERRGQRGRGKGERERDERERVAAAHADLARVVVDGLLVVARVLHVLDDDAVVRVLGRVALDEAVLRVGLLDGERLVQERVRLDHVVDDRRLGDLLAAELLGRREVLAVLHFEGARGRRRSARGPAAQGKMLVLVEMHTRALECASREGRDEEEGDERGEVDEERGEGDEGRERDGEGGRACWRRDSRCCRGGCTTR